MCDVGSCTNGVQARGLCNTHYSQWYRGFTVKPVMRAKTLRGRFMERVGEVDESGCWGWIPVPDLDGYPVFRFQGKRLKAHRVSYELHHGPIPPGLVIDHKCRNTWCTNPEHLQAVTPKQNQENRASDRPSLSGRRGVYYDRRADKFSVLVVDGGIRHYGGKFDTLAEADSVAVRMRNELYTNNLDDKKENN